MNELQNTNIIIGSKVTDKGIAKLAAAAQSGEKVDLKYLVAGDGGGEEYEPTTDQTDLKNRCWQGEITSYEISPDDEKQLIVKGTISSEVGGFTMREIGVLDSEGDLIAVTRTSNIDLIPYSSGQILRFSIVLYIQFTNDTIDAVQIIVRPTEEEELRQEFNSQILELQTLIEEVKNNGFTPLTTEEIDEITGEPLENYLNGESLSSDEVLKLLDDDPSNDPDLESTSRGLSVSEILEILGDV